jgi:hypothetical protein
LFRSHTPVGQVVVTATVFQIIFLFVQSMRGSQYTSIIWIDIFVPWESLFHAAGTASVSEDPHIQGSLSCTKMNREPGCYIIASLADED